MRAALVHGGGGRGLGGGAGGGAGGGGGGGGRGGAGGGGGGRGGGGGAEKGGAAAGRGVGSGAADGGDGGARTVERRARRGRAVQVDPIKPTLKPPGTKRLKQTHDEPLSSFAFKLNLRRYTVVMEGAAEQLTADDIDNLLEVVSDAISLPPQAGAYTRPLFSST